MSSTTSIPKLLTCVGGIYFFYLYYGIFQELIYRPSKIDGSRFKSTYFLLMIQCTVNAFVAFLGVNIWSSILKPDNKKKNSSKSIWEPSKNAPNYLKRIFGKNMTGNAWMGVISFTYVFAMGASNMALQYVNYPTQALGKSCKMIPIIVFNVIVNKTRYTMLEYVAALLITLGIVVFRVFKATAKASTGSNSTAGLFLLFTSLCLDGLTSSNQKTYRKEFSSPSFLGALKMMLHTNIWAILHVGAVSVLTGDFFQGIEYCSSHVELFMPILQFSVCSALGQLFIFLTITGPGPLACTTITTTRKFFTILLSVLMHPDNSLTTEQWSGVGLVFGGLGMKLSHEAYARRSKKK
jgi:solute carrier family 35 (UDP-galactose transporter), member B1